MISAFFVWLDTFGSEVKQFTVVLPFAVGARRGLPSMQVPPWQREHEFVNQLARVSAAYRKRAAARSWLTVRGRD
jgi:hypothetical protein